MKAFLLSTFAVFAPIKPLMLAIAALIAIDTITGIIAAYKRGEEIRSSGFSRVFVKMFVFHGVIVSGHLLETVIITDLGIPVVKIIGTTIGISEFKSLIENVESITGLDLLKIKKHLGSKNDK